MKQVTKLNPGETLPFVGEALRQVAAEVGNSAAVLGFVGAPFTLATYIVEVRGRDGEEALSCVGVLLTLVAYIVGGEGGKGGRGGAEALSQGGLWKGAIVAIQ